VRIKFQRSQHDEERKTGKEFIYTINEADHHKNHRRCVMKSTKGCSYLQLFGIKLTSIPFGNELVLLKEGMIAPAKLGKFAPAFVKIVYRVSAARLLRNGHDCFEVEIKYSYEHPSGSNGVAVRLTSTDGGESWEIFS
jgi:hypothetical protein